MKAEIQGDLEHGVEGFIDAAYGDFKQLVESATKLKMANLKWKLLPKLCIIATIAPSPPAPPRPLSPDGGEGRVFFLITSLSYRERGERLISVHKGG